jgi:large subunit ribosomal protein L17
MRRNLVQSLIEHGEIRTTLVKAKEVRGFAEQIAGLAIDGSLAARQRAEALLNDRAVIRKENQEEYDRMSDAHREKVLRSRSGRRYRSVRTRPGVKFTAESVIHKLFAEVGPKLKRRNEKRGAGGGYTRIIKLSTRRLGDGGQLAILQWVGEDDAARPKLTERTERKRRAKVRYAFYAGKPVQRRRASGTKPASKPQAGAGDAT